MAYQTNPVFEYFNDSDRLTCVAGADLDAASFTNVLPVRSAPAAQVRRSESLKYSNTGLDWYAMGVLLRIRSFRPTR